MKNLILLSFIFISFAFFGQNKNYTKELSSNPWIDASKVEYTFSKDKLVFGSGKYFTTYKVAKINDTKRLVIYKVVHPKTKKAMFIPLYWEVKEGKCIITNFGLNKPCTTLKSAEAFVKNNQTIELIKK